ncbi:hypothetical protein EfmU0317_2315 [Enterococcus faecium U0317]|nr:hypothetical protein EfmU0317_2315 [Enterococcus faecium U0317]
MAAAHTGAATIYSLVNTPRSPLTILFSGTTPRTLLRG